MIGWCQIADGYSRHELQSFMNKTADGGSIILLVHDVEETRPDHDLLARTKAMKIGGEVQV